jgi:hypothetical protein
MRPLHEEIRFRRESLGLDDIFVANVLGLNSNSYFDLEHHCDEWNMVVPFYQLRMACRWLGIDFLAYVPNTAGLALEKPVLVYEFIRERRLALGLSEDGFADACGFYPPFTPAVEAVDGLILYPFQVTHIVSAVLNVNLKSFTEFALLAVP